jgi:hypothetical protein
MYRVVACRAGMPVGSNPVEHDLDASHARRAIIIPRIHARTPTLDKATQHPARLSIIGPAATTTAAAAAAVVVVVVIHACAWCSRFPGFICVSASLTGI